MSQITKKCSLFALAAAFAAGTMALGVDEAHASETALLVPVDGFLTDADNQPVDGQIEVQFSLYADASTDDPFWTETQELHIDHGSFSAYMGSYEQLSTDDFTAHRAPYVALQVEGDSEMDRWPVGHAPFAAVAESADDAATLQGMEPDELGGANDAGDVAYDDSNTGLDADSSQEAIEALVARLDEVESELDAHRTDIGDNSDAIENLEGSYTDYDDDIADLQNDVAAHDDAIGSLQSTVATQDDAIDDIQSTVDGYDSAISSLDDDVSANQSSISDLDSQVATNEGNINALESDISSLQSTVSDQGTQLAAVEDDLDDVQYTLDPMTRMSVNGEDSVVFEDVNVHVRSGEGATDADVNGRGNLIVGYDEGIAADKTGSHNIIYGTNARYSSYGGLVGGRNNTISDSYASVLAGNNNTASGDMSVVVNGSSNEATYLTSTVLSGFNNEASGRRAVVSGGWGNEASGSWSVVSGGDGVTEDRDDYWRGGGLSSRD